MAKTYMDDDEYYPFTFIAEEKTAYTDEVEVDPETLARWRQVMADFGVVQDEMQTALRSVRYPQTNKKETDR